MLNQMRKHSKSWLVKLTLAMIVGSFALFFGYNRMAGRFQDQHILIAKIGDREIPRKKYEAYAESSVRRLHESVKGTDGKIPEGMERIEEMVKKNVLQELINREVTGQYAAELGLSVSDQEIATNIQSNKSLFPNGAFDLESYQKQFLPRYQQIYGENFEEAVTKDLLVEKMQLMGTILLSPWHDELEASLKKIGEEKKSKKPVVSKSKTPETKPQAETRGPATTLSTDSLFSLWTENFKEQIPLKFFDMPQ